MNDTFTLTDNTTRETVTISWSQYCDLIVGMNSASDYYEMAGNESTSKNFKKLSNTLKTFASI